MSKYTFLWGDTQSMCLNEEWLESYVDHPRTFANGVSNIIMAIEKLEVRTYYNAEELDKQFNEGKSLLDGSFFHAYIDSTDAAVKEFWEFMKALRKQNFKGLTNRELLGLFIGFRGQRKKVFSFFKGSQAERMLLLNTPSVSESAAWSSTAAEGEERRSKSGVVNRMSECDTSRQ